PPSVLYSSIVTEFPFNAYSRYLKRIYGERVYRIGVDGGFSCPNRSSDRRWGGCTFCDESGARSAYIADHEAADLRGQIERSRKVLGRRYGARSFILYFQAFSGTYAPVPRLRQIYDHALSLAPFRELIVGTRPDCVDAETASLLGSYRRAAAATAGERAPAVEDVWVELGLQSAHDRTLERIRRGHDVAAFDRALSVLRAEGVRTAAHVIHGLPGEGREEFLQTVQYLAERRIEGIKIHNLHVVSGTSLAAEYAAGAFSVPDAEEHVEAVASALELLPPETVVMRMTCDTSSERLIAPRSFPDKQQFRRRLVSYMEEHGMYQARRYCAAVQAR
ncbi:MAG: TIGR01212 family radical SAM protein, partial [Spirochaetaceae bacterium]